MNGQYEELEPKLRLRDGEACLFEYDRLTTIAGMDVKVDHERMGYRILN